MVRIMLVVLVVAVAALVGGCSPQAAIPSAPSTPAAQKTFMSTVKTVDNGWGGGFRDIYGSDEAFTKGFVTNFEKTSKMTLSRKQVLFVEQEVAPRVRTLAYERFNAFKEKNPKSSDEETTRDLVKYFEILARKHALEIAREVLQAN